ncbi:unnamed protein product [Ranitomeya imitator]|uniref:Reverse transcriptase domain-containing protein n=1 Tax=Ranitomeya imitator TaxID=111125 RepID=A0ABN9MJE0_9NEOB|nr:unnamed protein product [Ranitomeya imitator]
MSTNTFSYNSEETTSILSHCKYPCDFLKTAPRETRGRDLEREVRHHINIELHCATLSEYLRVQRIPRGLRVPLRPTLFQDSPEYCTKFEQILNKCSLDLITLTIEHLQKEIEASSERVKAIEIQLSSTGTPEELNQLKSEIKTKTEQHRRDIENRKLLKFVRDTEDYEAKRVYRWQDNYPSSPLHRKNRTSFFHGLLHFGIRAGQEFLHSQHIPFFRTTHSTRQEKRTRRSQRLRGRYRPHTDHTISGTESLIVNISSRTLGTLDCSVLQKGLSFCPTYRYRTFDLDMDLQRFFRSLRLKVYFADPQNNTVDILRAPAAPQLLSAESLGLHTKSQFRPPRGSHAVETFIQFIQNSFHTLRGEVEMGHLHYPPNLTLRERQSLQSLKSDSSLVIKPANKGGAIVIMDKSDYLKEIMRQLDNTTIYRKLDSNPTQSIRNRISAILREYTTLGVLDLKTCNYLTNDHPVTPVFYTLPKIHKNLEHPPGRPIVAATNSILSPIAMFLEKILTPHIQSTKSFLLDIGAFLEVIQNMESIPADAILASLDVKDLYTSIPHEEGINSVKKLLSTTGTHEQQINLVVKLLTIVLDSNHFLFQDQFYLQIRGTAMGSNVAPPYANCYMADFEESLIYPDLRFRDNVLLWKRYIDDIFCVWGGTLESLLSFVDSLNTAWPGISFTMAHDLHRMNFLDTVVIKDQGDTLSTDIHIKGTDRNSLLHFQSLHPRAIKKAIPKSQIQRVTRIVSDNELRVQRVSEMKAKFQARGYPESVLQEAHTSGHNNRCFLVVSWWFLGGFLVVCEHDHTDLFTVQVSWWFLGGFLVVCEHDHTDLFTVQASAMGGSLTANERGSWNQTISEGAGAEEQMEEAEEKEVMDEQQSRDEEDNDPPSLLSVVGGREQRKQP